MQELPEDIEGINVAAALLRVGRSENRSGDGFAAIPPE